MTKEHIESFVDLLIYYGLEKVSDKISSFSPKTPDLYVKQITYDTYLSISNRSIYTDQTSFPFYRSRGLSIDGLYYVVFNHLCMHKEPGYQGFDFWVAIYQDASHIGRKQPEHIYPICLGCDQHLQITRPILELVRP